MPSFIMLHIILIGTMLSIGLAFPSGQTNSDSANISPRADDGGNNLTAGQQPHACYAPTDQTFFSLASAHDYGYEECFKVADTWSNYFRSTYNVAYRLWSGKDPGPFEHQIQLPLYHSSDSCAIALMTIQQMYDFTAKHKIPWRNEWGRQSVSRPFSEFAQSVPQVFLGKEGLQPALECARQGQAGFSEIGTVPISTKAD